MENKDGGTCAHCGVLEIRRAVNTQDKCIQMMRFVHSKTGRPRRREAIKITVQRKSNAF